MGMPDPSQQQQSNYVVMPYRKFYSQQPTKTWKDKIADSFVDASQSKPGTFGMGILLPIVGFVLYKKYFKGKEK